MGRIYSRLLALTLLSLPLNALVWFELASNWRMFHPPVYLLLPAMGVLAILTGVWFLATARTATTSGSLSAIGCIAAGGLHVLLFLLILHRPMI